MKKFAFFCIMWSCEEGGEKSSQELIKGVVWVIA